MQQNRQSHRLRDFILYLALAVALAGLAILLGVYQAKTGRSSQASLKWVGFVLMTVLAFYWTVRSYRPFWRQGSFWVTAASLGAVHVGLGIEIVQQIRAESLLPFVLSAPIESLLLIGVLRIHSRDRWL